LFRDPHTNQSHQLPVFTRRWHRSLMAPMAQ
jgi:hypothetical protein